MADDTIRFVDIGSATALREPLEGEPVPPEGGTIAEVPVLTMGTYHDPRYGKFSVDQKKFDQTVANFEAGNREVALDYAHVTEDPDAPAEERAKAAGWIFKLVQRGKHLIGLAKLTANAAKMAEAEEIKYTSPVYVEKARGKSGAKAGKPVGMRLKSVAFTPIPFLDDQPALAMSEAVAKAIRKDWISAPVETDNPRLPESQGDTRMALNDKAIEVLGLAEGFTDDDASAAIMTLSERPAKTPTGDGTPTERETQLAESNTELIARVAELESGVVAREATELIDGAIKGGKILAAKREEWIERTKSVGVEPMATILADVSPHPLLSPAPGSGNAPEVSDETVATDAKTASEVVDHRARKLCETDKSLSYADACNRVLSDDSALSRVYAGAEE